MRKYAWDAAGNRTSLRKRDGATIGYTFDVANRMMVKDIPGGSSADVHYGYDLTGAPTHARFASHSRQGVTSTCDGFGRQVYRVGMNPVDPGLAAVFAR